MKLGAALVVMLLCMMCAPTVLNAEESTPEGLWLHNNERIQVKIAPCGEALCGTIVWLENPDDEAGDPLLDFENPDHAQRDQPVVGTTVLQGLTRSGPRLWTGGTIYNPDDGEAYSVRIKVMDHDTLHVRVYVLLPLFGETKVWTRVESPSFHSGD